MTPLIILLPVAEDLTISDSKDKAERYRVLIPQVESLVTGETDVIANLANIAAALKSTMDFFWVGFYLVKGEEMVLGPFQGPVACTRIPYGRGVCGSAWKANEVLVVPDVNEFPGHIACSSRSRSEIVLPASKNGEVVLVLDIDSDKPDDFDDVDKAALTRIMDIIAQIL